MQHFPHPLRLNPKSPILHNERHHKEAPNKKQQNNINKTIFTKLILSTIIKFTIRS
jgi:hypothetical protein